MSHEAFGSAAELRKALNENRITVEGYLEAVRHLLIETGASEEVAQRTARESYRTARGSSPIEAGFVFEAGNVEGGGVAIAPATPVVQPRDRPGQPAGQRDIGSRPAGEAGDRPGPAFSPFGETAQDRLTAFRGLQGERFPGGISPGVEQALNAQFNALSPGFEALRGLGSLPAGADFRTFLGSNLGQSGFSPQLVAQQAAGLFGRTDLNPTQTTFRSALQEDPRQQFNLALQSGLQGLPAFLAPTFRDVAERRFGGFQTGVPLDPTTGVPNFAANPFLPQFISQGGRF